MGIGKWIAGALGFMTMGPLGGLAAFALGHAFEKLNDGKHGEPGIPAGDGTAQGQRNSFMFSMLVLASYIMKADGKAIVIITHKLNEVMEVSDRVSVLRKGKYIGTVDTSKTNPQALTDMMVGHSVSLNIDRPKYDNPQTKLIVEGLTCIDAEGITRLEDVSFAAKTGEILGVAGISGSGQKELLEAMTGLCPVKAGSVRFINDKGEEVGA